MIMHPQYCMFGALNLEIYNILIMQHKDSKRSRMTCHAKTGLGKIFPQQAKCLWITRGIACHNYQKFPIKAVIRKIFLSETGTKDLEITKKWKIVSDKKVGDGHVPSIPQSVTGQKISDKNPPYLSPVNFFSISSSVTVYLAEFNLE